MLLMWWRKHQIQKITVARQVIARGRRRYMLWAFPLYMLPCLAPAAFFALCGDIEHDSMLVYVGSMMIVAALSSFVVCRMNWRQYVRLTTAEPPAVTAYPSPSPRT